MKNIYLKYTLLTVAIASSLLFTACGKKSEPVNKAPEAAESVIEDTLPTETDSESSLAEQNEVNLEDTTTTENTSGADITGVDYTGEATNDEYDERIHGEEAQTERSEQMQQALDSIEGSQEYKDLIAEIIEERYGGGSGGTIYVGPADGQGLTDPGDANPNEGPQFGTTDPALAGGSLE